MVEHSRLEAASQFLVGAKALRDTGDYAGVISRCYFAAFQTMWAALGEPTSKRRWEHIGIIQAFVRGRWDDPTYSLTGPGLYERFRFPLRRLYDLRLRVDYHVEPMTLEVADWALQITQELVTIIGNIARRNS
jgi:uncharacterized protein (UPF0332 family)